MKTITSAIIALIALAGALRAERAFFVFDNGLNDIKSADQQAALLQELGYDGIFTRPQHAKKEFLTAMDQRGIKIIATYVSIPTQGDGRNIPRDIEDHIRELKTRGSLVWLNVSNMDAADEVTVSTIQKVCDVATDNGLEFVLYPHLKLVQLSGADEIPPGNPDWKRLIQPLGQGTFDMGRIIRALDDIGYKGPVNLQCYQISQPARQHLSTSIEAWKNLNKPTRKP